MTLKSKKYCTRCKKTKLVSLFAKNGISSDGFSSSCLQCKREINLEMYKLKRLEILKQVKEYQQTEAGRKSLNDNSRRMYRKFIDKWKTRGITKYAIKTGKLKRGSCVICGEKNTHAHHPDYSKPLEVLWLCPLHHRVIEGKQKYL